MNIMVVIIPIKSEDAMISGFLHRMYTGIALSEPFGESRRTTIITDITGSIPAIRPSNGIISSPRRTTRCSKILILRLLFL